MRSTEIDCLENGAPHADDARAFRDFFASIEGTERDSDFVRCYTAFDLNHKTRVLRERDFDIPEFGALLRDCVETAQRLLANEAVYRGVLAPRVRRDAPDADAERRTQELYGSLFRDFSEKDYYETSYEILKRRFEINAFAIASPETKVALDAGCGGGRFSLALERMGLREVQGIDFSERNVETAIERRDARGIEGVHYQVGDVGALPFEDATFDFVFSMGVLHHTTCGIAAGLSELHRVLKPGGELLVAVMERPGGVLFDMIELLRHVMKDVPLDYSIAALEVMGLRGFRLYSLLDHVMVPINVRSTPEELQGHIEAAGFANWRRFERGLSSDSIERLHAAGDRDPDAGWKHGVGENRYLCVK